MDQVTKKIISEKLKAIYKLTDDVLEKVNNDGEKLRYPYAFSLEEIECAIFDYIEMHRQNRP